MARRTAARSVSPESTVADVRTSPFAGAERTLAPDGTAWPNGSAVFSVPERTRERTELGRIVREGTSYRVFKKTGATGATGATYRDLGIVATHVAALAALPVPGETRPADATPAAPAKMTRKPVKPAKPAKPAKPEKLAKPEKPARAPTKTKRKL